MNAEEGSTSEVHHFMINYDGEAIGTVETCPQAHSSWNYVLHNPKTRYRKNCDGYACQAYDWINI